MKRTVILTVLLAALAWPILFNGVEAAASFPDTTGGKYENSIEYLHEAGVVQGREDGLFHPGDPVNRAELLKMVFVAQGLTEEDAANCFKDVNAEWFAAYVCSAKDLDIVNGYEDGTYKPAQSVNMVEAFKIIAESFEAAVRDTKEGEAWYQAYANFMHTNNFASKYNYYPESFATREEVAFWVHQFMLLEKGSLNLASIRDAGSQACGKAAPGSAQTQFEVAGELRNTLVTLPASYDPNEAYPLLVAFHGRTSPNSEVKGYYGFEKAANGEAFIVYPEGKQSNGSFTWSDAGDASDDLRDYELFDEIVGYFTQSYCINEDEIYAAGHSLGAWFTNSLACARGDVLRAVASLGGARSESICTGPVSVMQWHNPSDRLAPFYTGQTARDHLLEQNNCSQDFKAVEPTWAHCVAYESCLEVTDVVWCPHTEDYSDYSEEYYPHTWPRETGQEMWDFFQNL
jgi:polyhydroxybutyrate depolymerase